MKKTIALGMIFMLMLLSAGGCYFAVGGYGWDRAYHTTPIIMVTMATIMGMADTTVIETTIGEGGMTGIDDASTDGIVHSGDLGK